MKIILIGYGKMGKAIEEIALKRGHQIVERRDECSSKELPFADVALEFTTPQVAFDNVSQAIRAGIPVVCGTTGWADQYQKAVDLTLSKGGAFLYASNFSVGVNVFFELNRVLASMMRSLNYRISIDETHHIHKKDAPSGTAISLAEDIISVTDKTGWTMHNLEENQIQINAYREAEVPGTHKVKYVSEEDTIEIQHTAHSRKGFALGAVLAAEWIYGKKGVFSMKDVLSDLKI